MDIIESGDLVQVVRDCCGMHLGMIFTVGQVSTTKHVWCLRCLFQDTDLSVVTGDPLAANTAFPLKWLKRIPPLEELDGEDVGQPVREVECRLLQSRWWKEVPGAAEWLAFQRDIGLAGESRSPDPPTPLQLDVGQPVREVEC